MSKKKKKLSKQPKSRTLRETAQKQQGPQTPVSAAPAVSSSQSVRFHPAVICAAVFFWYETVLKFSIGNPQWWPSLVHVFFFSAFCGIVLWILTSLIRKEKTGRLVRGGILILSVRKNIRRKHSAGHCVFCRALSVANDKSLT